MPSFFRTRAHVRSLQRSDDTFCTQLMHHHLREVHDNELEQMEFDVMAVEDRFFEKWTVVTGEGEERRCGFQECNEVRHHVCLLACVLVCDPKFAQVYMPLFVSLFLCC